MKVDFKSLQIGTMESEESYLSIKGRDSLLADAGGRFLSTLNIHLLAENTGNMLVLRVEIATTLALTCGRCLEEFEFPISAKLRVSAAESAEYEDSGEMILIEDGQAEIMPRIEEEIFSLIPLNPLCSEECRGLCPFCGANQNLTSCSCENNDIDPRWQKLKQLNTK
jgi:uncharacterized protein